MSNFKRSVLLKAPTYISLGAKDLSFLFDVVMDEAEGFDGEAVSVDYMIKRMKSRYDAVGLIPSRN